MGIHPQEEERIIEDFLQGQPRAQQWREWKEALKKRLSYLRKELSSLPPEASVEERGSLEQRIQETQEQIYALEIEEIITQFVEDSIRLALHTFEEEAGNEEY